MISKFSMGLRWYLWILMGGLFLQGLGSLLFRLMPTFAASAPYLVRGILGIDAWHATIHIIWGAVGMAVLAVGQGERRLIWLALIFGVFYTALAVAGVLINHPFGLMLDRFENAFHLTAGPLTLVIGALALRWLAPARALTP